MTEAKIVIWDIETSFMVVNTWNLYPNYISPDAIVSDWSIICGAWKVLGEKKIHAVAIETPGDDKEVVIALRDALVGADIIVHHNGDKFDLKKLNTRLLFHKLDPLPPIPTIDTLKEVRKVAAFSSNKLDYIAKVLLGKGKIHVDYSLWLQVMRGSKKALKEMVAYNKVDVEVLEEVYERIKPFMKSHPHVGKMQGKPAPCSCRVCGSVKLKKNGIRITAAGAKRQEYQCGSCGAYQRVIVYESKEAKFGLPEKDKKPSKAVLPKPPLGNRL
jgi:DNA polymerase elongation subunit (family B)